MQSKTPTVHCDAEDGFCGAWDVDFYASTVSAVNGVRVTRDRPAPGWVRVGEEDFCPEHAPTKKEE
jgi:hypothetical protein